MSSSWMPEPSGREPSAAELATSQDPRLGIAYAVSVRSEGGGENAVHQVVLTYRLQRRAPDGRELPVLQVEMRGRHLQGMVADGDLIQAPAPVPLSGAVQLKAVMNLTTGTPVVLMRPRASTGCAVATLVVLGVLVALMVLAFLAFALTGST